MFEISARKEEDSGMVPAREGGKGESIGCMRRGRKEKGTFRERKEEKVPSPFFSGSSSLSRFFSPQLEIAAESFFFSLFLALDAKVKKHFFSSSAGKNISLRLDILRFSY